MQLCEPLSMHIWFNMPSCVPACPLEESGEVLEAEDLACFKDDPNVLGLGEMMNSVGVLNCDPLIMKKLDKFSDMIIDGHDPMGTGHQLNGYVCAGINTDHESISSEEAIEKTLYNEKIKIFS